jgi:TorA maturation chaperone TorD
MSPPGRPKGESPSAQREGSPVTAPLATDAAAVPALDAQVLLLDLLRRLFLNGPNRGMADALAATAAVDDWPPHIAVPLQTMRAAVAARGDSDDALLDLEVEFTRLTIGPLEIPAMPYASFYLSPGRTLMTEDTLDVRRRYLEAGVAVRDLGRTPDDHLGIELEFLHFLTLQAALAEARGDEAARDRALAQRASFVEEHAALWMPAFAEAFAAATEEPAFQAAAQLLRAATALR